MNLDLTGYNALVCGSTQGIGLATAKELASLGADLILVARNEGRLMKAIDELPNNGEQKHHYIVADFSFPPELRLRVEEHIKVLKNPVHILVNNTGGPPGGPVSDAKPDEFVKAFTHHLICNQLLVQTVLSGMKAAEYGRIINVISTSVKQPIPGLGVSNTVRGAVANWAKTLAGEVGQYNITVNNVLPGATNTQRLTQIIENKSAKTGKSQEDVLQAMSDQVPMKRVAEPEEIANVIAFLASPAASYINGINVPVDGGRTACL